MPVVLVVEAEIRVARHIDRLDVAPLGDLVGRRADGEGAGERDIDRRGEVLEAVGAGRGVYEAVDAVEGRLPADHIDRAAHRILAEHRSLRAAQHFDVIDVEKAGVERHRKCDIDAVLVVGDRGLCRIVLRHVEADAADRDAAVISLALRDHQSRHLPVQIDGIDDVELRERISRQGRDGHRRLLQVDVLFLGDHLDFLQ